MDEDDEQVQFHSLPPEGMILPADGPGSPPPENGSRGEDEDSFEGEGTEEVVAKVDKPDSCAVNNALHRLVELCEAPENGLVTLDKLMAVIESQGFQCSDQDEQSLNQVYNALWAESESKGLVTNGSSGKRDVHVDIHGSKVIRNLLDDYQRNAHLEDIWEPGLSVLLDSKILSSLEMSMFSYGSKEGIAGDISILDLAQLESERSQFQHTLQRLTKEKEDAIRQWSQLEEANHALAASNKDLLERVRSLCQEAEQHLVQARAAKAALESQLEKRIAEVDSLQERLTKSEVRAKKASEAVAKNRVRLRELESRNLSLKEQLSQESSKLFESSAVVQDLSKTVETLEHRQKDTEDELRQQRVENLRLREVLYERNSVLVGDTSTLTGTELHDTSPASVAVTGEPTWTVMRGSAPSRAGQRPLAGLVLVLAPANQRRALLQCAGPPICEHAGTKPI
ncbi:hypothetical protein MTO96_042339 [Rhipicephalus appendiculatus]